MVGLFVFVLLSLALPVAAAGKWVKISSPNFELYTNAGEKTGRKALLWLEQIHQVFGSLAGSEAPLPLPTRVFLFRSAADFRPYRLAESTAGYYQNGPQRNYIVIQHADLETFRIAFHEYIHLVLNHSTARLPRWFEEGTAEFYSTMETDPWRLSVGRPIPQHVRTLATTSWLNAETLWSIDRNSPEYNERDKTGIFYAQCWALVHMLNLSPRYREDLSRFVTLLEESAPAGAAFEEAFERSLNEALQDLQKYVRAGRFSVVKVGTEPGEAIHIPDAHRLPAVELALAQAELLTQIGRKEEAERIYRRMARQNPTSPETETGLGALALTRHQYKQAGQHLRRAIELGSQDGQTYFEYAMLLRESQGSMSEVTENLRKAIALSPNFAEAHFMLGTLLSKENRYSEAVEHLRHAASILPRQAYFWHALALAHHHLSQGQQARRAAYRAFETAATEQEAQMAQAALRLVSTEPAEAKPRRTEVITPKSWQHKRGDSIVEGTLHQIDCLGTSARFYIRSGDTTVSLFVKSPHEVQLRNLSSVTFEFRCGPQEQVPVAVEYIARPDRKQGTDGDVVAIEFR